MNIDILDFHIRKLDKNYQLDIYERDNSQTLITTKIELPSKLLNSYELRQLDFDAKDADARIQRLREFGENLYKHIFTSEIVKVWNDFKKESDFLVLCIRIAREAEELESLPWETLFDGKNFIALDVKTTISRLPLDTSPQKDLPSIPSPLQMFALVSSPLDLPENAQLQIEREQEILLEAINDPAGEGKLQAEFEDEAKLEIIENSLETPYQILHYTGHGISPQNGGGLLLEDFKGKSRPTSVAEILQTFGAGQKNLRLVVLSGCQTAKTISVGGFQDMGRGLTRQGIPAVIAMQFSISDIGGLKFAEVFYRRVVGKQSLEMAVHSARRAMWLSEDNFIKADALAIVLLTANGECLKHTKKEAETTDIPKIDMSFYLPLPQLKHGFYGRRQEFRRIRDGIVQQNQRAVIIHGIGGIGKTALASYTADRLRKHFKGVYAFNCSSGTLTPETIIIELNRYLLKFGIDALDQFAFETNPPDYMATILGQILSQIPLLLIFDNFESQIKWEDKVFEIADENLNIFMKTLIKTTATNSHFLFTSRYLFNLDDRRLGTIQSEPLHDLRRPKAIGLMQKLQHLSNSNYTEKLNILELFGGHPYALITLNSYCNHESVAKALTKGREIHAELREFLAIELNYSELSETSQKLLNRVSAFKKNISAEALEWVMGEKIFYAAEKLEEYREILTDELKELDDKSLLELLENTLPERRKTENLKPFIEELIDWGLLIPLFEDEQFAGFSIHTLIRDFCREKQSREQWNLHLRDAAGFYTNQTKLIDQEKKTQSVIWTEMEAFELLMESEDFIDAAKILLNSTKLLDRWGFGNYLESHYRRLLDKLDKEKSAGLLHNLGTFLQNRGDYKKAIENFEKSLKIAEEMENQAVIAMSLHHIGMIHYLQGQYEIAIENYEKSLKIAEGLGDLSLIANSLGQIGTFHRKLGENGKAVENFEKSLKIAEELKDHSSIAKSLHNIGMIYQDQGENEKAIENFEKSLKIKKELGNRSGIATSLHQIGIIYQHQGEYEKAIENFEKSLEIREELENRSGIASSLGQIGQLYVVTERYDGALRNFLSALLIFSELKSPYAGNAVNDLRNLRSKWDEENFDKEWKEMTGEDLPDWLIESEE